MRDVQCHWNSVTSANHWGGCLRANYAHPGSVTRLNATQNQAMFGGGLNIAGSSDVNVTDSSFADMISTSGAAISMDGSQSDAVLRVRGSTFKECHAVGKLPHCPATVARARNNLHGGLNFVAHRALCLPGNCRGREQRLWQRRRHCQWPCSARAGGKLDVPAMYCNRGRRRY